MKKYNWSKEDDILICYLWRVRGDSGFLEDLFQGLEKKVAKFLCRKHYAITGEKIAEKDMIEKIKPRISDIKKCVEGRAAPHTAESTKSAVDEWKNSSQEEHEKKCKEILESCPERPIEINNEIHIDWEGPYTPKKVQSMNDKSDYGIYQFYGCHPVYGTDTLLYIGMAEDETFASRMKRKDHKVYLDKYSTSDAITIFVGRLAGKRTPDDDQWKEEIKRAAQLLIYAHSPAWNSEWLDERIKRGHKLFDIHVMNWGKHKQLLPEVSGRRYAREYPVDEDYQIYGKSRSK